MQIHKQIFNSFAFCILVSHIIVVRNLQIFRPVLNSSQLSATGIWLLRSLDRERETVCGLVFSRLDWFRCLKEKFVVIWFYLDGRVLFL
jgi:hypothetical protein